MLTEDSRSIEIYSDIERSNDEICNILRSNGIDDVFSSPPHVGQIDYHEKHAYVSELFGLERIEEIEIGPLFKGQTKAVPESYVEAISDVLLNCRRILNNHANIPLVDNDMHSLYPSIAERS